MEIGFWTFLLLVVAAFGIGHYLVDRSADAAMHRTPEYSVSLRGVVIAIQGIGFCTLVSWKGCLDNQRFCVRVFTRGELDRLFKCLGSNLAERQVGQGQWLAASCGPSVRFKYVQNVADPVRQPNDVYFPQYFPDKPESPPPDSDSLSDGLQ